MSETKLPLAIAATALIVLSACSTNEDSAPRSATTEPTTQTSTTAPADSEPELRPAVVAYSDAFLTGDAEAAYAIYSERCQDRRSLAEFSAIVEQAAVAYGTALPLETYSADVSGSMARVTYTYADAPEINQDAEPWVVEGDAWRQDDC